MIELTFLTSDPDEIDLCRRYWQLARNGKFAESMKMLRASSPDNPGLERHFFGLVIARDTRRRCPTCGIPAVVAGREDYLAPLPLPAPCRECLQLKDHLRRSKGASGTELVDGQVAAATFRFPVAAMALVHALGGVVHMRELRSGFSMRDCEGFAPAHLHRFLARLCTAGVIEKVAVRGKGSGRRAPTTYRLTTDPAFEQDFAEFMRLLKNGASFDHGDLAELWLDYAVAECVAFICAQAAIFGLPIDPNDGRLCSALRTAAGVWGIGQVWSISRRAIQDAAVLVEHGHAAQDAVSTLPRRIARRLRMPSGRTPMPEPIIRTISDPRTALREWFDDWYGVCEHINGAVVTDLFHGMHNTRTPHKPAISECSEAQVLEKLEQ